MSRLLSIPAWVSVGLWTILWSGLIFLVYLNRFWMDRNRWRIHRMAGFWGRGMVTMAPGCSVQVTGREHLPSSRAVIFMANHQSYADIPVLYSLREKFRWMADAELFRIPFFGWAMRMAGYLPIRRGDSAAAVRALDRAKRMLSQGISIFVFPEGTRSRTGVLGRFQSGGFRLAITTGTPIVPVVVLGTRQLLPRNSWVFRPGVRLQIHLLPPVVPQGDDPRQIRRLARQVRGQMREIYRRHLREVCPPVVR